MKIVPAHEFMRASFMSYYPVCANTIRVMSSNRCACHRDTANGTDEAVRQIHGQAPEVMQSGGIGA
jgi:hypothetical protein